LKDVLRGDAACYRISGRRSPSGVIRTRPICCQPRPAGPAQFTPHYLHLPPEMKRMSVIVADDVPGILDLVGRWLEEAGHTVRCVSTGLEASQLLKSHHFDLVITDILMPDGDGLELILELKHAQPAIRILAISGGGRHMQAMDCLKMAKNLGAHAMLMKPFSREQLFAAMNMAFPVQGSEAS
jgi:CheY-like chemotaxis protein